MKEKSLSRLAYDVTRPLEAKSGQISRQRGDLNGDPQPDYPREKKSHAPAEGPAEKSRQPAGDAGEIDRPDIAEEIEGTGAFGPGYASTPVGDYGGGSTGLPPGSESRVSRVRREKREQPGR